MLTSAPVLTTSPPDNNILIGVCDLVQLLLPLCIENIPYVPPAPLFFQHYPHSAWASITLLTLTHPETEYLLTTQLSNGDTLVFSESYSAKSAVAVPPDHQIFQHAPTFPSYLYRPNQPFRTRTTTELTIAQSLLFVQELLTPYQFPLHTLNDWNIPLTLSIRRTWPTKKHPRSARLILDFPTQNSEGYHGIHVPDPYIPLPENKEIHYSGFHQDLFLGLLLATLSPPRSPDTPLAESPWLLLDLIPEYTDQPYLPSSKTPQPHKHLSLLNPQCYATPTTGLYHQLGAQDYILYPNPTLTAPPWLNTSLPVAEINKLPVIPLFSLLRDEPLSSTETIIRKVLFDLQTAYDTATLLFGAC